MTTVAANQSLFNNSFAGDAGGSIWLDDGGYFGRAKHTLCLCAAPASCRCHYE